MLSATLLALIRNPETPPYAIRDAVMEEEWPVSNVYVVMGSTGQYSDYRQWYVNAYLDPEQAAAACELIEAWCKEEKCHVNSPASVSPGHQLCPLDPNFQCDYTGTHYEVVEIPLRAEAGA